MSSMRNAIQRRNHRERAQPKERERWGLLEKHKDYSARARDFNAKKAKLRALRQKVLDKNPDEFYFGMLSRKGPSTVGKNRTGTVNGDRGSQVLSQDVARLLKTQDLGYVRTMRNKTMKEVEKLREQAVGIKSQSKKVLYVDTVEEQVRKLEGNIDKMDEGLDGDEDELESPLEEGLEEHKLRRLKEKGTEKCALRLAAAEARLKTLTEAEEALDLQRAKMAKSPTLGGFNKQGVKFKVRERKR